jgi:hypothetical protein
MTARAQCRQSGACRVSRRTNARDTGVHRAHRARIVNAPSRVLCAIYVCLYYRRLGGRVYMYVVVVCACECGFVFVLCFVNVSSCVFIVVACVNVQPHNRLLPKRMLQDTSSVQRCAMRRRRQLTLCSIFFLFFAGLVVCRRVVDFTFGSSWSCECFYNICIK